MILYTPEEIKKIMEDNFEKSMDLPDFYHNLLREFKIERWVDRFFIDPKVPAKTPLFTSEDGVPIYEDSIVWWLDITTGRIVMWNNTITQISVLGRFYVNKYFSTEAAAKEYWEKHKPKKVEVNVWGDFEGKSGYFYYQFNSKKEITKDKFPAIKQAIEYILNK